LVPFRLRRALSLSKGAPERKGGKFVT
jgi:hypothetical protein